LICWRVAALDLAAGDRERGGTLAGGRGTWAGSISPRKPASSISTIPGS
jgi:hypothetical protein